MKVTIRNDDPARTATVTEETFAMGQVLPTHQSKVDIAPYREQSFYVHAGKRLLVSEDPDAVTPYIAPPEGR